MGLLMVTLALTAPGESMEHFSNLFSSIAENIQRANRNVSGGNRNEVSWRYLEPSVGHSYNSGGVILDREDSAKVATVSLACEEEVYAAVNGVPQSHRGYNDVSLQVPWRVRKRVVETSSAIDELVMSQARSLAMSAGVRLQKDLSPFDVRVGYVFQSPYLLDEILKGEFPHSVPSVIVAITPTESASLGGLDLRLGVLKPVSPQVFAHEAQLVMQAVCRNMGPSLGYKYTTAETVCAVQVLEHYVNNFFIPMLRQK